MGDLQIKLCLNQKKFLMVSNCTHVNVKSLYIKLILQLAKNLGKNYNDYDIKIPQPEYALRKVLSTESLDFEGGDSDSLTPQLL